MNTPVTSREAILATCRNLVSENGITSINMRSVAQVCQVALGSIYYYFPSKNNLLIATIES
ncbi:TetR/AcrR family transcriptional regulator, partial [Bacillus cereus group sp. Bce013]|uniref:TetR/AcrR family transcriptional regulator n=1 Tax=Bacillus cereus group sp. Bce013 TaxID=3445250 RepID=UPI003F2187A0